jgi:Tol biopolymer transport system component
MKLWFLFLLTGLSTAVLAQEIYLLDFSIIGDKVFISRVRNISNNPGYDNQPCFANDGNSLLYAASRNGQTDILRYDIADSSKHWITNTAGSEYSPIELENGSGITAVKLDKNGFQRLWKFSNDGTDSSLIHPDLKIGYHLWLDSQRLSCFVLDTDTSNSLNIVDLKTKQRQLIWSKPGRCIKSIPGQDAFSFIDKSDTAEWHIKSYDLGSGQTKKIITTPKGSEDYCWTPAGNLLIANGSLIYWFSPAQHTGWVPIADLYSYGIKKISRMAVNDQLTQLAIVVSD